MFRNYEGYSNGVGGVGAAAIDLIRREGLPKNRGDDYADAVTRLHSLVPAALIRFLDDDGLPVRKDVLPEISRTIAEVWHSQSDQAPRAEEASIGPRR